MHQGWASLDLISINLISGRDLLADKKSPTWHSIQMIWTLMRDLIIIIIQYPKEADQRLIFSTKGITRATQDYQTTKCNMQPWEHIDLHPDIKIPLKTQAQICLQRTSPILTRILRIHLGLRLVLIMPTNKRLEAKDFKRTLMTLMTEEVTTKI